MFDLQKPTTMLLGRWQPWHDGHTELFKRAYAETGQVCIMVRNVSFIVGQDAGAGRTVAQDDNPFSYDYVVDGIEDALHSAGFTRGTEYVIMQVPNIIDISEVSGVGYTLTKHDLGDKIHNISATKIRKQMREEGTL